MCLGLVKSLPVNRAFTELEAMYSLEVDHFHGNQVTVLGYAKRWMWSRKKVKALIEQLKNLQDNLGDFNDLCVQQEYLLKISAELPANQRQLQKTLVAIGSLIDKLDHKKQTVKNAFARTFTNFAAPENQALIRQLFASK